MHREVIDTIRGGTALFAYYPEERWLQSSAFLSCETDQAMPRVSGIRTHTVQALAFRGHDRPLGINRHR